MYLITTYSSIRSVSPYVCILSRHPRSDRIFIMFESSFVRYPCVSHESSFVNHPCLSHVRHHYLVRSFALTLSYHPDTAISIILRHILLVDTHLDTAETNNTFRGMISMLKVYQILILRSLILINNSRITYFREIVYTIYCSKYQFIRIVDYYTRYFSKSSVFHHFPPKVMYSSLQLVIFTICVPTETL